MPRLNEYLHYRTIDVSSIKEVTRRWFPKAYFNAPAKTGNHRALGDIQDSIAELAYYRQAVFNSAADSDENTSVKQGPTTP
jgi:oligoribonuclease